MSRRRLLGGAAVGIGGIVVGGLATTARSGTAEAGGRGRVPFYGEHQAGIATPAQDRLLFASFDLTTSDRAAIVELMRSWTRAAARLTAGEPIGSTATEAAPPPDTGEAFGLDPARLTLTFGFGPTLFQRDGADRYGLAPRRPEALVDLPAFPGDALDPARSGGDLCVQACGDDPQVLFHAIRNLTRIGRGAVVLRWVQEGFGRTSSTTSAQATPRNLMGFRDGTNNVRSDDPDAGRHFWVPASDTPGWMSGGSYLVARRIRILVEIWDRSSLADQEATIGRHRESARPSAPTTSSARSTSPRSTRRAHR